MQVAAAEKPPIINTAAMPGARRPASTPTAIPPGIHISVLSSVSQIQPLSDDPSFSPSSSAR
ncbi:MAG: hypothetical protein CM1200mP2_01450 [Planctomycetaceae bacterium]|nr:MAG: hypothetical protein CM1200mP2_01450 [Planctomycetaceae bacterium]